MAMMTTTTTTTTATTTVESEILKRNTDCVYFLASPLTCKKGSECEYRHNDIARLNPRDCWYWLNGNCLNPTCAFRHPPLEGLTEISSNSAHATQHSLETTCKSNVPCYFYFNTYCMKGDQCPFSHAMDDVSHPRKLPKTAPEVTTSHIPVNKGCAGSNAGPAAVEVPANLTAGTSNPKELLSDTQAKDVDDNTAVNNISDEPSPSHESPGSSNPDYEEPIVKSPDNPSPEDKYMSGREDLSSEHSSEELLKDHTEAEEWWESSPGFDVLVDDGSEQIAYEDDADYLQARERDSDGIRNHLMHYEYEDSVAYDPMEYPDGGFIYDHNCLYDAYEHFSDGYAPDYTGRDPEPLGKRILDSMSHRKRRSSRTEWDVERHGVDLRDHLRKRRRMDAHFASQNSRKYRPSRAKPSRREYPEKHGMYLPYQGKLSSELGSELERNRIRSSHSETESLLDESRRRGSRLDYSYFGRPVSHARSSESQPSLGDNHRRVGRLTYSDFRRSVVHARRRENRDRRGRRERQPSLSKVMEIERRPGGLPVTSFTGPKSLAQIKQEKRRVHAGRCGSFDLLSRNHRRVDSTEFEGPKPLSELLRDKKLFMPVRDDVNESATDHETTCQPGRSVINGCLDEETKIRHRGTAGRLDRRYSSGCLQDNEDEEDDLARKVAGILA